MKLIVNILSIVLPCITAVLIASQVVLSNQLATLGKRTAVLEEHISIEKDRMMVLETEVASRSALMVIHEKALQMGFSEPSSKQIVTMTGQTPVALDLTVKLGSLLR